MIPCNNTKLVFLQHSYIRVLTVILTDCCHLRAKIQNIYFLTLQCVCGKVTLVQNQQKINRVQNQILQQPLAFVNKGLRSDIAWISTSISKLPDRIFLPLVTSKHQCRRFLQNVEKCRKNGVKLKSKCLVENNPWLLIYELSSCFSKIIKSVTHRILLSAELNIQKNILIYQYTQRLEHYAC